MRSYLAAMLTNEDTMNPRLYIFPYVDPFMKYIGDPYGVMDLTPIAI